MIYRVMLLVLLSCVTLSASAAKPEPLKVYDQWGGDFTLTDHNGIPLSLTDFRGKVVLLSFGYTHCPDICPTTMLTMQRLVKLLGNDAEKVQVLFITLDPERDTAERLSGYMEYFNPGFIALTGSLEEIGKVAKQYGTRFEKEPLDEKGEYSIAHTGVIYLIDQQGRIRVFFKVIAGPTEILPDVKRLLAGE
jgi:protein SCO1/2